MRSRCWVAGSAPPSTLRGPGSPSTRSPAGCPSACRGTMAEDDEPRMSVGRAAWIGVRDAFRPAVGFLDTVGGHVILFMRALSWLPRRPVRARNYVDACEYIGFGSLPIVLL